MKFIVHHTCSKTDDEKTVLKEFPFLSEYVPDNNQKPYLGEGYYFWDYNLELCKSLGEKSL
jgi:hypothetical protein